MEEFVCADGRMSVNGVCYISKTPDQNNNIIPTKTFDEKFESIEDIPTKDYSKDVKSNFEWSFDKVGETLDNFATTVKDNINAYDNYVGEKFGISKDVSHVFRAGAIIKGVGAYGVAGALAPFAIPFLAGGALKNKISPEQYKINQEQMRGEVAVIQNRVDTQYQDQRTTDRRDFSVSGPDTSSNAKGKSNQASSERGYSLHG